MLARGRSWLTALSAAARWLADSVRAASTATRRRAALALLTVLVLPVSAAAVAADNPAGSTLNDPQLERDVIQQLEAAKERERQRATPEAAEARQRSRSAYADKSGAEALELAKTTFPKPLTSPLFDATDLPGQEIVRAVDDNTALVRDDGSGQKGLLEAREPLVANDETGDKAPVDLDLGRDGSHLESENPSVPVTVGDSAAEGLRFERPNFSLRLAGAADSEAQLVEGRAFYPKVNTDTDLIVTPTEGGVEISAQLRSASSPESLPLDFDAPAGSELRRKLDSPGDVELVAAGKQLAQIASPMVVDADGESVPASYAIEGDKLVLKIDHRSRDLRYPLLADPRVSEGYDWHNNVSAQAPWSFVNDAGSGLFGGDLGTFSNWGKGLRIYTKPNTNIDGLKFARWTFPTTPGDSYYTRFNYWWFAHQPSPPGSGPTTCATLALQSNTNFAAPTYDVARNYCNANIGPGETQNLCVAENGNPADPCDYNHGTRNNIPLFRLSTWGNAYRAQAVTLTGQVLLVASDRTDPNLTSQHTDTAWLDGYGNQPVALSGTDGGLGMQNLRIFGPNGFSKVATAHVSNNPAQPICTGSYGSRCPETMTATLDFDKGAMPEGESTWHADAIDIIQRPDPTVPSWKVRLDRTAPSDPALSGALANESADLYGSHRDLEIDAHDDHAGVKSVEIQVDDQQKKLFDRSCPTTGCPKDWNDLKWRFVADDYSDGEHKVKVIVKDQLADQFPQGSAERNRHTKTKTIDVTIDHRAGNLRPARFIDEPLTDRMRSRTNLNNGNLLVEANDLRVAGLGMNLTLARYYNSRSAQTKGRLGYGWQLSAGEEFRIQSLPNTDDVRLRGPSGYITRFPARANEDGEYNEPAGVDAELTHEDDGTYELKLDKSAERLIFNAQGLMTQKKDRNDNVIDYDYTNGMLTDITDTRDRHFQLTYTNGLLTGIHDDTGNRQWTFTYVNDELRTSTDPNNKTTSYTYLTKHRLNTITDPNNHKTVYTYDSLPADGAIPAAELARVASVTRADEDPAERITQFNYGHDDDNCQIDENPSEDWTDVTDARNNRTRYCRDENDPRVRRVIDSNERNRDLAYDSATANVVSYTNGSGASDQAEYDDDRNLESVTSATGAQSRFTPNGSANGGNYPHFVRGSTDAQGNTVGRTYNTKGNLNSMTASGRGGNPDEEPLLALDYNGQGSDQRACSSPNNDDNGPDGTLRCSKTGNEVEDENDNETSYDYIDANGPQKGNLTVVDPPGDHGRTTFTWDDLSRLHSKTDAMGNTATYEYDNLDRVTEVTYSREGEGDLVTTYTPDGNGNIVQRVDGQGTTDYTYSARNQLLNEALPGGTNHAYTYDDVGNLDSFTDAGAQVNYTYNNVNLLSSVVEPTNSSEPASARTTTFTYNAHNSRVLTTFPNGVSQNVDYEESQDAREDEDEENDDVGDTSQIEGITATKGSQELINLDWSYVDEDNDDKMSEQRQEMDDHRRNEHTEYDYDHLNRLSEADTNGCPTSACSEDRDNFSYEFDPNSNRLMSSDSADSNEVNYGYNETNALCWKHSGAVQDHKCTPQPGGTTTGYDYDLNGNLTDSGDGRRLRYNIKDQTISARVPGSIDDQPMSYFGDDQNERRGRGNAQFGTSQLGLSSATNPDGSTYFTRGSGGELLSQRSSRGREYYLTDSLGSVVGLTDQNGSVLNRYRYDPFGNRMDEGTTEAVSNPFRFGGEYYDSQIQLYKQGLRYYDPELGQWTQRDPLDQLTSPTQANRYAFVGQDPVNRVDPSGAAYELPTTGCFFGCDYARVGQVSTGVAEVGVGLSGITLGTAVTIGCAIGSGTAEGALHCGTAGAAPFAAGTWALGEGINDLQGE